MVKPQAGLELDKKYKYWRWRIFGVTWLAYAGFYLTRKSFSVAKIALAEDPDILMSNTAMGVIDGVYLTTYAIGQFLWGICGDRFGTRVVILCGMLTSVVVGFAMGISNLVLLFGVFFAIQGFCQSTGWAPLAKNISQFFSQRERGVAMGWWCTNYAVGGMVASPFAALMADYFLNWRYAFFGPAVALFGIWLLFFLFQKNRPEDVGLPSIEEYHGEAVAVLEAGETPEEEPEGSWKTILEVLKNRTIWTLGAVYFFLKPTRYAILFWAPKYVNETLGSGMTESAIISVLFEAAGPLSVLFGGYVSDRLFQSRRMPISVICLLLLAAVLFAFNTLVDAYPTPWMLGGLFFVIGFLLYVPDSLVAGTAAIDFGTKKGASTASGFINGCGSIGAIAGGSLPGFISDKWGWNPLFICLAVSVTLGALLLAPKWNALPPAVESKPSQEER